MPPLDTDPEPAARVFPLELSESASELELRRTLANAGLPVDITTLARLTAAARPPFRVSLYQFTEAGGSTNTVRWLEHGRAWVLPSITATGLDSVPLSFIALSTEAKLPVGPWSADPSQFPVLYRAFARSTDYLQARARWSAENPARWLNETRASSALFAWTVAAENTSIPPVVKRYLTGLPGAHDAACEARVAAAHARGSRDLADFSCGDADDLARSLDELDFQELRLSRWFGAFTESRARFAPGPGPSRSPIVVATDLDLQDCLPASGVPVGVGPGPVTPWSAPPAVQNNLPLDQGEPVYHSDGSCNVSVLTSDSQESCSGDSSASDSSAESCSGDSSASDSSAESCSGDSSASDSSAESCSGDSSSSDSTASDACSGDSQTSDDSSGCGKSEYDGDTCSGSSKSGAASEPRAQASAELRHSAPGSRKRPVPVRLSLLTLLAAGLALPLRRVRAWR